ncbi:hypothetical protein OSB04_019675 [Centaurea solstitialis]|uniref:Uncharacterized protein n=1 Tax=Centaurea solstitialis TaxID=347529 RepID=A0AA38W350_9ASTR|nr:hypothetical protein OSB04_019675 [Centaurea solstitialis]
MDVVGVMVNCVVMVAVKEVVIEDIIKGTEANFAYEYKEDDNPDGPEDHNNATYLDVERVTPEGKERSSIERSVGLMEVLDLGTEGVYLLVEVPADRLTGGFGSAEGGWSRTSEISVVLLIRAISPLMTSSTSAL